MACRRLWPPVVVVCLHEPPSLSNAVWIPGQACTFPAASMLKEAHVRAWLIILNRPLYLSVGIGQESVRSASIIHPKVSPR